jgi:hypothetical protein
MELTMVELSMMELTKPYCLLMHVFSFPSKIAHDSLMPTGCFTQGAERLVQVPDAGSVNVVSAEGHITTVMSG